MAAMSPYTSELTAIRTMMIAEELLIIFPGQCPSMILYVKCCELLVEGNLFELQLVYASGDVVHYSNDQNESWNSCPV